MQVKQLSPTEISELIKQRIEHFDLKPEVRTEGTIVSVKDGVVKLYGLADVMQGEMIEFAEHTYGLALNLERDSVGAVVLGRSDHLSEGQSAKCTGRILEVPVGEARPRRERQAGRCRDQGDQVQGCPQRRRHSGAEEGQEAQEADRRRAGEVIHG